MRATLIVVLTALAAQVAAHSDGLNKKGCHAGSQPYHCHRTQEAAPSASADQTVLTGKVTHVRDGDTIEVNGIAIRLSALDCPERGTQKAVKNPTSKNLSAGWDLSNQKVMDHM